MKALLDTNIILDVFLNRRPFVVESREIWRANEGGRFEAYVSGVTAVNLFYIGRKLTDESAVWRAVGDLLAAVRIAPIDANVLRMAYRAGFRDYEDAVQHASAVASRLDAIITRDTEDYVRATLPVLPTDFLRQLPSPDLA